MAKILLVEDDPSLISLYQKKLEQEGFSVNTAMDGQEGLIRAEKEKYDLIILDLVLPMMDGIEVLKRIKSNNSIKNTPVLILTNLGASDVLVEQAQEFGAEGYLVKYNISLDEITQKIRFVLEKNNDESNE